MTGAHGAEPLDDALRRAVALHRTGRLADARAIYEQVLVERPDSVDALHFFGLLAHQSAESESALVLIARALELQPGNAAAHSNLGNVLRDLGRLADARISYENALACDPEHVEAHNNLGVLLRGLGDPMGSIEHLMTAIVLKPDWPHAHLNLGNTYASLRRRDRALDHFRRSIELDPTLTHGYRLLGWSLASMGRADEAAQVFRQLLAVDPGNSIGEHMLAACRGKDVPERASKAFVAETFDDFAASFERHLAALGYRGPEWIVEALGVCHPEPAAALQMLDLGCGTGLCGAAIRPWAARLTGVDLSAGMLARAEERGGYEALVQQDLVAFLGAAQEPYDVIVSADTLIYFGALGEVFAQAHARLVPGGLFFFTLEKAPEGRSYHLYEHGRYGHSRGYIQAQLRDARLEPVQIDERVIRLELGEPVAGFVVTARRMREGSDR